MRKRRVEVGKIRRAQIIDAAVAIIADQGLQNLSLSEIEQKVGMSRGQLTYYFPHKEDILLGVFDRLLEMLHQRARGADGSPRHCDREGTGWERLRHFLHFILLTPPEVPEFHALQYTFLSQIGYREDFRQRLANLYEEWRNRMALDLAEELARAANNKVGARTLATFVQALLHGLAMQRAADPTAYDRQEMLDLCLGVLGNILGEPAPRPPKSAPIAGKNKPYE
jgi:AcrR family transcriptional regulator